MSFIGNYESRLQALARARGCVGVICGRIHTPADKRIGDVRYLNSGDRVESLTALVEHHDGRFEVLPHAEFRRRLQAAMRRAGLPGRTWCWSPPDRPVGFLSVPSVDAAFPPPARPAVHSRREKP